MSNKLFLAVVAIAALTNGCASITGTTNQSVSVQTREQSGGEVTGAACELTNNKGKWFVTTPGSVMIHRSNDDMQVLCNKTGFEPGRAAVVSETKASMFGNIIFGGGIGAIIDHNQGSAYEYPAFIQIMMGAFSKIEPPKASDQPAQGPATTPVTTSPSTQSASTAPTLDEKLKELKRLYDSSLISQDVYLERQRKLLEAHQ
ncbi:MAG: SHOCT domain-containing protein [Betaproteobacteria bacterium]|nr:SHOCT domain-containing protein [Betaproteobacteria bacterium]